MNDDPTTSPQPEKATPRWQSIGAIDRRVAGVLVEKAKTTPSGYPMSLNSVCTASNQKSNRAPVMNLQPDDVEESLDRLRKMGAVGMVEGYGRVTKYRHYLYEWLGVDKVEIAVMAELLLRGPQTVGELRGRAARMEPIPDLAALQPVLAALKSKGLVISLTPEGRGHVVTHGLYQPKELEKIKAQYGAGAAVHPLVAGEPVPRPITAAPAAPLETEIVQTEVVETLRRDLGELRSQLSQLRSDLDDLASRQGETDDQLRQLRDALGG